MFEMYCWEEKWDHELWKTFIKWNFEIIENTAASFKGILAKNSDLRQTISKYGKHSIRYLGPYLWGKINKELRSKTNLQAFKKAVRAINVLDMLDGACRCHACSS